MEIHKLNKDRQIKKKIQSKDRKASKAMREAQGRRDPWNI